MLRRTLLSLLGLLLLTGHGSATWSIVCVNLKTREVGVVSATCLENFNLRTGVPVIYVGEGAAAAQSFLDVTGDNKRLIFDSFRTTEETPEEILMRLAMSDAGHQSRQYGILNFAGPPVTFTGRGAGRAATGVTGQIGDLVYAIQGNVLTGDEVVFAVEEAFRAKKGDMGQKMVAGMEAGRALGGDGRCSCAINDPTGCGVPPPSFTKSAHVGVMIIARVGDTDGICNARRGCATGDYYLNILIGGNAAAEDPVIRLQRRYDTWRREHVGRPDGLQSVVGRVKALPADGVTERTLVLELRDLDERLITHGGALVEITTLDGEPSLAEVGPVRDLGNGRYTFTLRAGRTPGTDRFSLRVTDVSATNPEDVVVATLYPPLEIATIDRPLFVGEDSVSSGSGARLSFVVNRQDRPEAPYWLVARLAPTGRDRVRGLMPGGLQILPIQRSPFLHGGPQLLDQRGRSETVLDIPSGALGDWIGQHVEFTGYVLGGAALEPTNSSTVEIVR